MKQMVSLIFETAFLINTDCSCTEIFEDVKEECAKYGPILDVKMPRPTGGSRQNNGIGKIYIKYEKPESAKKALAALAGRKFADRTVVVTVFGEEYFDVNAW
jgi:splicing factor U2AF subunit